MRGRGCRACGRGDHAPAGAQGGDSRDDGQEDGAAGWGDGRRPVCVAERKREMVTERERLIRSAHSK